MKKKIPIITSIVLAIVLIVICVPNFTQANKNSWLQNENIKLQNENIKLQQQKDELQGEFDSLNNQNDKLATDIDSLKSKNNSLKIDFNKIQKTNEKVQGEVDNFNEKYMENLGEQQAIIDMLFDEVQKESFKKTPQSEARVVYYDKLLESLGVRKLTVEEIEAFAKK